MVECLTTMRSCPIAADIIEILTLRISCKPHAFHYETTDGSARPQARRMRAQADVFVASARVQSRAYVFGNSDATSLRGCIIASFWLRSRMGHAGACNNPNGKHRLIPPRLPSFTIRKAFTSFRWLKPAELIFPRVLVWPNG